MGYAPALLWEHDRANPGQSRWKPIVCPVTSGLVDVLREQPAIAGLVVELHRPCRRRNGEVHCTVIDRPIKDPLPPAFDVEPILRRMWRLRQAAAVAEDQGDGYGR